MGLSARLTAGMVALIVLTVAACPSATGNGKMESSDDMT
jgi:hypothetical protein